jgi:hypothetical protein
MWQRVLLPFASFVLVDHWQADRECAAFARGGFE